LMKKINAGEDVRSIAFNETSDKFAFSVYDLKKVEVWDLLKMKNINTFEDMTSENLIFQGENLLVKEYSNELQVTPQTPPTFIVVTDDDEIVPTRNSVEFYLSLKKNNVPAELHVFSEGHHGFFLKKDYLPVRQWPNLFLDWMKAMKIIE